MEVLKKVLNIIIDILIILVVIISAVIAVVSITTRDSGVAQLFGYVPFSVQSNSMSPVFEAGDLIVGKKIDKDHDFKVGDIITFWTSEEDENGLPVSFLNTHRIVEINKPYGNLELVTQGDNNSLKDKYYVSPENVVSIWSSAGKDDGIRIQKLGEIFDFLRKPAGFFIAIVLPMAAFFIYELVRFITNLLNYNKEKSKQAALEAAKELMGDSSSDSSGLSEEQKAQAILEYLEKQKTEKEGEPENPKSAAPAEAEKAAEVVEEDSEKPEQTAVVQENCEEAEEASEEAEESEEAEKVSEETKEAPQEAPAVSEEPQADSDISENETAEEIEQPATDEAVTDPEQVEAISEANEDEI